MRKINPFENPFAGGLGILLLLLLVGGGVLTLSQIQQQQNNQSRASTVQWYVGESASAACIPSGTVNITVKFTNEETSSSMGMLVTAKDGQTGKSINLGTVNAGQTVTGDISTGKTSLAYGTVTFNLAWANGSSGTDSRTASYHSVSTCPQPTSAPTLTPKPTPTSTPKPTPTSTPKPTPTVLPGTPTPTTCPTPGTVQNVKIICPYCTPTPSP